MFRDFYRVFPQVPTMFFQGSRSVFVSSKLVPEVTRTLYFVPVTPLESQRACSREPCNVFRRARNVFIGTGGVFEGVPS